MICAKCPAKISFVKINKGVKRAIKIRLEFILKEEEARYKHFKEFMWDKMKPTRRSTVERSLRQRIQSLRIVIWMLTPAIERNGDFPGYWKHEN